MGVALLIVAAVYLLGLGRLYFRLRAARDAQPEGDTLRFDPTNSTHEGWIAPAPPSDTPDDPYRIAAVRPARQSPLAIRCTLVLKGGKTDATRGRRRWRVRKRSVRRHDFGLHVSTNEILPVVLDAVDDRVEIPLRPRRLVHGVSDKLVCDAFLSYGDKVTIEGAVESNDRGKQLRAKRIIPVADDLVVVPPRVYNLESFSTYAMWWTIAMGVLGLVFVLVTQAWAAILALLGAVALVGLALLTQYAIEAVVALVPIKDRAHSPVPMPTYTSGSL